MEHIDAVRYGLILAIQAEIDGMKVMNDIRKQNKEALAYGESDFQAKAEELRNISYCHDDQL